MTSGVSHRREKVIVFKGRECEDLLGSGHLRSTVPDMKSVFMRLAKQSRSTSSMLRNPAFSEVERYKTTHQI